MTPDAGSSKDVQSNRGFVAIPEKGDQVMVGFEFGDPNRPYVMGSLFHAGNGVGGGVNNAVKSIITRSGHTLKFNDVNGSVLLKDKGIVNILFDGAGNATMSINTNCT